jgi:hypothetical protein
MNENELSSQTHRTLKDRRLTGIFSFLMPGLGQAYLGHYAGTAFFFPVFILFLSTRALFLALPVWALISAFHAFRSNVRKKMGSGDPTWRNLCYASVGFVAFFGWMMLFSSTLIRFR